MCFSETCQKFSNFQKTDEDDWYPIISHSCQDEECPEKEKVGHFLAHLFRKLLKKSSESSKPKSAIKSVFSQFSESTKIDECQSLSTAEKEDLASLPSRKRLLKFFTVLSKLTGASQEVTITSIILLKRLLKKTKSNNQITVFNWRPLLITSIHLSLKLCEEDSTSSLYSLQRAYPLFTVDDYVKMENVFLSLLDFSTFVSTEEYVAVMQDIRSLRK
mmetsp:Transcript_3252/g.3531  ORF Transcript_3252/g.3531 Transcript_3252/m.3531 type:complete len:217 (-) Transcript_3252:393-1043(-)